mgnify:CR=1 FL=1
MLILTSLSYQYSLSLENIDNLKKSELAWSTKFKEIKNNNYDYEVIYENKILDPWKLIIKK